MVFKEGWDKARAERFETLRDHGFMRFEAKELSLQSLDYPQMRAAMRARLRMVNDMLKSGLSIQQIRGKIYWLYRRGELKKPWDIVDQQYPKGKKRFKRIRRILKGMRQRAKRQRLNYKPGVYDEP